MAEFFRRVEKKYIINQEQYEHIMAKMNGEMIEDSHGQSKICNIYFDTKNYDLISHSIQKPVYKDKVRLRSYNVPNEEDTVYLEIKRKYDGVVSKRRIEFKLKDAEEYLKNKDTYHAGCQVQNEIDYYFEHYNLVPKMFLSYDRRAYYDKDDVNFRITFDTNIIARNYDLELEDGSYGTDIFEKDKYIMEIKTLGAIPMWFVDILSEEKIFPCGFSKYGEAYTQIVLNANGVKEYVI